MYANSSIWRLNEHSLIINGTQILRIRVGRYRFIDSLNFFNVSLSKLPKMFSLQNNLKGYYPHAFNIPENLDYVGPLPDIKYFWPNNLKCEDRKKLLEWYTCERNKDVIFNNKEELLKYCKEDVNILRNACLKFRAILYDITGVEPFYQTTLAGTAMTVFTTNFMNEKQISVIPRNGYRFTDNQSIKALKWLEWESHIRKVKVYTQRPMVVKYVYPITYLLMVFVTLILCSVFWVVIGINVLNAFQTSITKIQETVKSKWVYYMNRV